VLVLGNTHARRDWGYAKEYVEAMWLMLQRDRPEDYVIATGKTHSVEDWVRIAFDELGLDMAQHLQTDVGMMRPIDPGNLVGDNRKARERLGWVPQTDFETLVRMMVRAELEGGR
jgi:GDPmannose 4,6-dehydratase